MSSLERKAIQALRNIKKHIEDNEYLDDADQLLMVFQCDAVLEEYETRNLRLGEKENLSKG